MSARARADTLTGMTLLDLDLDLTGSDTWTVDGTRSCVALTMRVCGMLGLRGRFTRVRGHLERAPDAASCRVHVDVDTASLTAGSVRRDALLAAAGVIDPAAGPMITFRSHAITEHGRGWRIGGVLGTDRCAVPLHLHAGPLEPDGDGLALRATGRVTRDEVLRLVARPGAGVLLGPEARLDLTLAVRPSPAP